MAFCFLYNTYITGKTSDSITVIYLCNYVPCLSVCMHACVYVLNGYTHACMCMYVCMHICTYVCKYVCTYVYHSIKFGKFGKPSINKFRQHFLYPHQYIELNLANTCAFYVFSEILLLSHCIITIVASRFLMIITLT